MLVGVNFFMNPNLPSEKMLQNTIYDFIVSTMKDLTPYFFQL